MKPLPKKDRIILTISLSTIFFILAPILVLYSTGYRFDLSGFGFTKTGGIFIHSDLSATKVFINDELVKSNGVFLKNTLVQNLKADYIYKIKVEKEGYITWYKDLIVYPNIVTESKLFMLPVEIKFEEINKFLDKQTISTTTPKTLKLENPEYANVIKLFEDSGEGIETSLGVSIGEIFPTTTIGSVATSTKIFPDYILNLNIENLEDKKNLKESNRMIAWIENGDVNVVWAGSKSSTPFFFCDVRGCRDKILVSLDTDISFYDFFPGRNDVLIVATKNHIFAIEIDDRSRQNIQTIYQGESPEFRLIRNTIFIKESEGLYKTEI